MARPTPFDRQFSFTQYSSQYPSRPQNGADLDAEFNVVKVALDETQANLALIQDADGKLARASVGRAQLDSSVTLGFKTPSSWAAGTAYTADVDTVFYLGRFYVALNTHISGVSFDAAQWTLIADLSASTAIADGGIVEAKLADGAVASAKIADLAVTTPKLATNSVTGAKIADNTIPYSKLLTSDFGLLAAALLPAGLGPVPWSLPTLPAGWDWADGGVLLSSTAFPVLRAAYIAASFPHGQDGSGNPKKPDVKGRVVAGLETMGGGAVVSRLTTAGGGVDGATLGAVGGSQSNTLITANLPAYTPGGSVTVGAPPVTQPSTYTRQMADGGGHNTFITDGTTATGFSNPGNQTQLVVGAPTATFAGAAQGGSSTAFTNAQPTIVLPMIIKAH